MNDKYTAEQVESVAEILEQDQNALSWKRLSEMLNDYATHLREREAAKAGVTDEMVLTAIRAWDGVAPQLEYNHRFRAALEAVAPMLALTPFRFDIDLFTERCLAFRAGALWGLCNPRCNDEPVELYASRPSNDYADTPWNWDRDASQAMLASARVPEGWRLGDVDVAQDGDMWTAGIDIPVDRRHGSNGIHASAIECHAATKELAEALRTQVMLAATLKTEKE